MRDWSGLLGDLLAIVASRIQLVEDFMAFRGVCSSWRAAASMDKFIKTWPTVPLLMLAEKKGGDDDDDREFYCLSRGKICMRSSLSEAKGKKCMESKGWLITIGESGEVNLLHPFTRAQIELPNLSTLPEYEEYASSLLNPQVLFVERAILSASPSHTSDFVLMLVHSSQMYLGFWKPGHNSWTRIESTAGAFSDVNYYNGKFYAISYCGIVWVWDGSGESCDLRVAQNILIIDDSTVLDFELLKFRQLYLVESSGELVVVGRSWDVDDDEDDDGNAITKFIFIKLDLVKCEWKEITSLGTNAVFVGHNTAFSIDATSDSFSSAIKPNCVYFSDDYIEAYCGTEQGGGKKMGIYHIEDGIIEPFDDIHSFSPITPPLWVAPSF